ncbi:MAG: hypothetical protein IT261_02460, partial [Saprospiraceae bacterium]|nr:hypothetical protein [Saprospiraceae bacterium]
MEVSAMLRFDEITTDFWKWLKKFEPFGPHNQNPMFWAENVYNSGRSRILENNHVKLSLRQEGCQAELNGIGFGLGKKYEAVQGRPFDILFHVREEEWQGHRSLGLYVKDIR